MAVDGTSAGTPPANDTVDPATGLPGHTGAIGCIESLVLDGRRLFFGFSSNQMLSPLIDDAGAMALFAARHMRQRTGAHDEAYWAELVRASIDGSDLVWSEAQSDFSRAALEGWDAGDARGHLLCLLDAATLWDGHMPADLPPGTAHPDDDTAEERVREALRIRSTVANWSLLCRTYARGAERAAH
ncbi:hypothetical protein ACIQM0_27650 [Streptomyces sp. NPDC091387]|uniref:hypothetical protein n=1 Tax=Streptomyces sp. NPDC091387 TaxID=3365998 RepID=UPI00380201D8